MEELWLPVDGYEGIYEVSNLGRVKSCARLTLVKKTWRKEAGRILKPSGAIYSQVILSRDNTTTTFLVHRLVATSHVPNTSNKPDVNHKDGNKRNNASDNLEWCTKSENTKHSFDCLKRKANKPWLGKFGSNHNRSAKYKGGVSCI